MTGRRPTVAAVAIAKNEAARIRAWVKPLQSADRVFLLDTGSTDMTVTMALELGCQTGAHTPLNGFRFDTARNDLLERVRDQYDYVFWVDLDETVEDGWREKFEVSLMKYGMQEIFSTTRIWGSLAYERPTIHKATRDWTWRRAVHEELIFKDRQEYSPAPTGIQVSHDQDPAKDRSQYLALMKIAVDQDPDDTQIAFWYARELMYHGDVLNSVKQLRVFSHNENAWVIERMQACLHLDEIYTRMGPNGSAMRIRAIQEAGQLAPWRREPYLAMARYQRDDRKSITAAQDAALQALAIPHTMRPQDYLTSDSTWDDELIRKEYDLA